MADDTVKISPGPRFLAATVLALTADALQILVMPFFAEGALSPANDVLDIAVAVILVQLLGWHWEFLPALIGELMPGVRSGSVLDVCSHERVSKTEADGGHGRRSA